MAVAQPHLSSWLAAERAHAAETKHCGRRSTALSSTSPDVNAALGLGADVFALGLTLAYTHCPGSGPVRGGRAPGVTSRPSRAIGARPRSRE